MTWRNAAVERVHFPLANAVDVQQHCFSGNEYFCKSLESHVRLAHYVVFCRSNSKVNRPFLTTRCSINRALLV